MEQVNTSFQRNIYSINQNNEIAKSSFFRLLDNLINAFATEANTNTNSNGQKQVNYKAIILCALFGLAVISIIVPDGLRAIYRKNLGRQSINLFFIALTSIMFLFFGGMLLALVGNVLTDVKPSEPLSTFQNGVKYFYLISSVITAIIFFVLGIKNWIMGFREYKVADAQRPNSASDGDSRWFNITEKRSSERIKYWDEPACTILVGVLFSIFNPIGGIIIIACGFAIWIQYVTIFLFNFIGGNPNPRRK